MSYVKGSQLPSVTTVADTDTLIVTQEGDSKATKKVAKSDLLKEDRTRLTNLETDNTTNKSNITNLQKSLENKAEKNHTHNYAGSSTAGGPAITAKYPGVIWTATTQVGTWSALCKTTSYVSFILSITANNGLQCGFDTFIVSTGYKSARIYQLCGNGYNENSGYQLRLVKEDNGFRYTLEIKNDYSYNGAKTSDIECRYIVTSNHDYITTYSGAFVASTNNDVVYSITTSPNNMIGTISNAIKDSEGNIIKDTYVKQDEEDITVLFERNNGTINKNINTCFNSSSGKFTAPETGQYLVMCSGYELSSSSSEYVACVLYSSSSNQNKLYTTGSSGFTLITLNKGQTLAIYTATAGNMNKTCISSNSAVNMLIARIN